MRTSDAGIEAIKRRENFSPLVYNDAGGRPTIGFGHLVKKGEIFMDSITKEEGKKLLVEDVGEAEEAINTLVCTPLSQNQFDALVSLVYNIGHGQFSTSTLLAKLNNGDYEGAENEFSRWVHVGEKVVPGLVARRYKEASMFGRKGDGNGRT